MARLHLLAELAGPLVAHACAAFGLARLDGIDSKPVPVCTPIRHSVARLLRKDGAWWADLDGRILHAVLRLGNVNDRVAAWRLSSALDGGFGLDDLGYSGVQFQDQVAEATDLRVLTRA